MPRRFCVLIFMAAMIAGLCPPAAAKPKMVLIIVNRVNIAWWADPSLKGFREVAERGAAGLMVTRHLGKNDEVGACATLGAGGRAIGHTEAAFALRTDEPLLNENANDVYAVRTGLRPPAMSIVNIGFPALTTANLATTYLAKTGLLGKTLREHGIRTAFVGNADFLDETHREASLIVTDERGVVPGGETTTNLLERSPRSPFGVRTNMRRLEESFRGWLAESDFVAVDLGDTQRADAMAAYASPDALLRIRNDSMRRADAFVQFVLRTVPLEDTQVIVLSAIAPSEGYQTFATFGPIAAVGRGIPKGPALLTTASTRWPGIVVNTDFAAHALSYFGVPTTPEVTGSPFETRPAADPLARLTAFQSRDSLVESMVPLLKVIVILLLILFAFAMLFVMRPDAMTPPLRTALNGAALFAATCGLSFILMPLVPTADAVQFVAAYFGLAVFLALAAGIVPGAENRALALAAAYTLVLVADQFLGGPLARGSVLGYYPQMGARYYGIGNELMGFLVSGPTIGFALLLDSAKNRRGLYAAMAAVFALCAVAVGYGNLGANVGGLIACVACYFAFAALLLKERFGVRALIAAAVAAAVLPLAAGLLDFAISGEHGSHFGRLIGRIASGGGGGELSSVIVRKVGMNFHLLGVSYWSFLCIGVFVAGGWLLLFTPPAAKRVFQKRPFFMKSLQACLVGAGAAFLANDSGLIPAATSMIVPLAAFFLMSQTKDENKKSSAAAPVRPSQQTTRQPQRPFQQQRPKQDFHRKPSPALSPTETTTATTVTPPGSRQPLRDEKQLGRNRPYRGDRPKQQPARPGENPQKKPPDGAAQQPKPPSRNRPRQQPRTNNPSNPGAPDGGPREGGPRPNRRRRRYRKPGDGPQKPGGGES